MYLSVDRIPSKIFFNEYLPDKAKLIYIYLVDRADKKTGICSGCTSSVICEDFWTKKRAIQVQLANLYEAGIIDRVEDEEGNIVPKVFLSKKGEPIIPDSYKDESSFNPNKDFLKLLKVWNELFDVNTQYSPDLFKLYKDRCSSIKESDILKAVRNRYKGIKDDPYYSDPSKIFFRTSLKYFLKDHDSVDIWINSDKSKAEEVKEFRFEY